jgi:hypothetical protein
MSVWSQRGFGLLGQESPSQRRSLARCETNLKVCTLLVLFGYRVTIDAEQVNQWRYHYRKMYVHNVLSLRNPGSIMAWSMDGTSARYTNPMATRHP